MHGIAIVCREVRAVTHVVFHVTIEVVPVVIGLAGKLLEDVGIRLVEDVGERVQPAAVGHPDDELLGAQLAAPLHDGVQCREQAFSSLDTEALLSHKLLLEEFLEDGGLVELAENLLLLLLAEYGAVRELDVVLEPAPTLGLTHVHVLDADGVAVGGLEVGDDIAQGGRTDADLAARFEYRIHVGLLQPEVGDAEVRAVISTGAHGVRLGEQVAPCAVCVDQIDDAELLGAHGRSACLTTFGSTATGSQGLLAIDALGKVETEEKVAPTRIDQTGVLEELPIERFDGGGLGIAQVGMEVHAFAGTQHKVNSVSMRNTVPDRGFSPRKARVS